MALVSQSSQALPTKLAPFTGVNNATVRLLKAISAFELASLQEGDVVYTESVRDYWKWLPASVIASNDITYCAPTVVGAGAGRFERLLLASPDWSLQTTWVLDEANSSGTANDENDGLTATTPLASTVERRRRMGPKAQWSASTAYHLRYISTATSDILEGQCGTNVAIYLHASMNDREGVTPALYSGSATTVVTVAPATNIPWQINSAGLPVSWTASGLIDKRVRLTSGANINALAWAALQDGVTPKNVQLSEFMTPVASFNVAPFVAPASTSNGPSNGDTFVVENLRTLTRLQIDLEGMPGNLVTATSVILDSLATTLTGNSNCAVYADGGAIQSNAPTSQANSVRHNCQITGSINDVGPKSIIGGYLASGSIQLKNDGGLGGGIFGVITFFTFAVGGRYLYLAGSTTNSSSGITVSKEVWQLQRIGFFNTTTPSFYVGTTGVRFGGSAAPLYYGSGNTSQFFGLAPSVHGFVNVNYFDAANVPVVTADPAQFLLVGTPVRTSCPALDTATNLFTADRVLSFTNLRTTVLGGGFSYSFTDPLTGAGVRQF